MMYRPAACEPVSRQTGPGSAGPKKPSCVTADCCFVCFGCCVVLCTCSRHAVYHLTLLQVVRTVLCALSTIGTCGHSSHTCVYWGFVVQSVSQSRVKKVFEGSNRLGRHSMLWWPVPNVTNSHWQQHSVTVLQWPTYTLQYKSHFPVWPAVTLDNNIGQTQHVVVTCSKCH